MNIRWVLFLIVPTLVACGSEGDSGGSSSVGGEDGPKWRVEYSGDLNGEVSGDIMSVAGIATNTMLAGAAMNEDSTGAANESLRVTITRYGDEPQASVTLNLADDTKCLDVTNLDPKPSRVDVSDSESKTFRAEISGTLYCGPGKDKRIDFTAYIDADA